MEVILLEKVRNLGNLGDKVNVKAGFGRNFLIPQGKGVFANKKNIELFEQRRAELEEKAQQQLAQAQQRAAAMNELVIVIESLASEEGKLYGSVGILEVLNAIKEKGIEVHKREINMTTGPIHSVGEYEVEILLHSDVTANLRVEVAAAKG